ncbi:hypothetical protein TRIUR3_32768 [Triticum urartu]|uniref:Uncharacterized protein n=1 Tax=Triticum urartu TaxID=4572 RepID=M8A3E7_TRIUA|nr:hypothetical protein TRIUR3_32768 [Triticum urartu]
MEMEAPGTEVATHDCHCPQSDGDESRAQRPCRARADPWALRRQTRRGGAEKIGESASLRYLAPVMGTKRMGGLRSIGLCPILFYQFYKYLLRQLDTFMFRSCNLDV